MKFVIVFAALFAVAFARPGSPDADATVVAQQADISPDHSAYTNSLITSNGIKAEESGTLRQAKSVDETASYFTTGQFSWTAPDGVEYTVKYTADENGAYCFKNICVLFRVRFFCLIICSIFHSICRIPPRSRSFAKSSNCLNINSTLSKNGCVLVKGFILSMFFHGSIVHNRPTKTDQTMRTIKYILRLKQSI